MFSLLISILILCIIIININSATATNNDKWDCKNCISKNIFFDLSGLGN